MTKSKSVSRLEWLQFLGVVPFTVGFFLALFTVLGRLLIIVVPRLGEKWVRRFSESGVDIDNHPFQILLLALALMVIGGGVILLVGSWARRNERLLRERLRDLRSALQRYNADRGRYPRSLSQLVADGYLRRIPADPMRWPSRGWYEVRHSAQGDIRDVRSRSPSSALDGTSYDSW